MGGGGIMVEIETYTRGDGDRRFYKKNKDTAAELGGSLVTPQDLWRPAYAAWHAGRLPARGSGAVSGSSASCQREGARQQNTNRTGRLSSPAPKQLLCSSESRRGKTALPSHWSLCVPAPIRRYSRGGEGSLWRRSRLSGGNCTHHTVYQTPHPKTSPQNTWRHQNGEQRIMTFSPDGANCPSLDDKAELQLDGCAGLCDNGVTSGQSVPVPASVISHLARFPYLPASKQSRNQKGS